MSYFLRWKLETFGYHREVIKTLNIKLEKRMEIKYKRAKKCKSRLQTSILIPTSNGHGKEEIL